MQKKGPLAGVDSSETRVSPTTFRRLGSDPMKVRIREPRARHGERTPARAERLDGKHSHGWAAQRPTRPGLTELVQFGGQGHR